MKKIESTIIGYRKFTSKAGKDCCIVTITREGAVHEIAHGLVGMVAEEVFVPDHCYSLINESVLGKCLIMHHSIIGGRAYLEDIEIK